MLNQGHPNYGLKQCGYCGYILHPGRVLRSSGTCSETCEIKRIAKLKRNAWAYKGIDTRNRASDTGKRRR